MTKAATTNTSLNYDELQKHSQKYYRRANDIYIDAIAVTSFLDMAISKNKDEAWKRRSPLHIRVPSHGSTASITRNPKLVREMLTTARNTGQWEKSLVFLISLTEDMIASYIRLVLRSKPILLLKSIKGNDGKISINLADILKVGTENVLEEQVANRVASAIYASPKEYISYIGHLLDFELNTEILNEYIETKARRDVVIHANGIVNKVYLDKSEGIVKDMSIGDRVVVDKSYFEQSLRSNKRIVKHFFEQIMSKYGNDEDVKAVITRHGI